MASNKEATLLLRIKTAGEEALDRVGAAMVNVGKLGAVAFGAISALVVKSIADYRQQEEATNALTRAMINQGVYSKDLKDKYLETASALQKVSLYGDEQIIAAQGVLQGFVGQKEVSKELTKATLDLAAAKKIDLTTAAELVGKTIGTETNALARQGIEINANASRQEKLAQVIAGVNKQYAGQAEAAADGYGVLKQLENILSDIFETIGERLSPVIFLFAGKLKALGTDTEVVTNLVDGFMATLQALTQTGVIVAGIFEGLAKIIGTVLGTAFASVSQAIKGDFSQAWETIKSGTDETMDVVISSYDGTKNRLKEINAAFIADTQASQEKELAMAQESGAKKAEVAQRMADEENAKRLERLTAQQDLEMALINTDETNRAAAIIDYRIKTWEEVLKNATTAQDKLAALNNIYRAKEDKANELQRQKDIKDRADTYATIATLANSNNKSLAAIGKAAAITQIAIETPVAIAKALSAFPPPFNFVAAGLVGAAMAAQAANIAGVQLAEGGIVLPRPGGTQATIGEAGQAEAVIPLDRMGEFGMGGGGATVVINAYGGMLGTEAEARQFAIAVDRELLKLRQNHESVSFDSGVV